jgi:hypothetical protein
MWYTEKLAFVQEKYLYAYFCTCVLLENKIVQIIILKDRYYSW